MISSNSVIVLVLTFRYMIDSELIFVLWDELKVQIHFFWSEYPIVPESFVEETLSPH